jgi:hypothetical protein
MINMNLRLSSVDNTQAYVNTRGCIQKFPDRVDNEIHAYLWYYSLRSNIKGYGGKTH